ncbi:MAG: hypothetical protein EBZ60_04260 [Betaproteobacteria bacterium]|nr:hypothetical protein [Betaproteobacteria bacterium]
MAQSLSLKGCRRATFFCFSQQLLVLGLACQAMAGLANGLPNPSLTPGATDPAVTQDNLKSTVCVRGYTSTVRPDKRVTNRLKREQIQQYGYPDRNPQHYEQDHLIPISIGGNPSDPRNMWPQPLDAQWGAQEKNDLEFVVYRMVCNGDISLEEAQQRIANNWIEAYQAWVPSYAHYLPRGRRVRQ